MKTQSKLQQKDPLEDRRREGIRLLRKGWRQAAVAKKLKVSRQAVQKWWKTYQSQGLSALRPRPRTGRPPELSDAQKKTFLKLLLKGPTAHGYATELWTTRRMAKLLSDSLDVSYHRSHVWKILVSCGWSCQKPTRQARERNPRLIQHWVAKEWPRIKKKSVA